MKRLMTATALALALGSPAFAQDRPAGYWALDCDPEYWIAVRSEQTGKILYWNNRTCAPGAGSTDGAAAAPVSVAPGNGEAPGADNGKGRDRDRAGRGNRGGKDRAGRGGRDRGEVTRPGGDRGNRADRGNRSGLGDGTNPGRGAGRDRSPNEGTNNPGRGRN